MKVLKGILKEELMRLKELKRNYEKEISKLPKGCLIKKKIKGHIYYYLNFREGQKKHFKYLGKIDKKELEKLQSKINERRKFRKLHIQVKNDIKKLEKMVHGKKK